MSKYLVSRANALVFGVFVAILTLVGAVTWERFSALNAARGWTQHSYEVLGVIKDLEIGLRDAETGQRGFLLTGNDDYLEPYQSSLGRVTSYLADLQRLTSDNPAAQRRLHDLAPIMQGKLEELAQTVQLRRDVGLDAAMRLVNTGIGREATRRLDAKLAELNADEEQLLAERQVSLDSRSHVVVWLVLSGGAVAIAALLMAVRLLNQAWARSSAAEADQRKLALQLRTSLDSLSQGVGVFAADHTLTHWNECFKVLLELPRAMLRDGTSYSALAEHGLETGIALETRDQLRHTRQAPGEAVAFERTRSDGHQLEIRRTSMPDGGFVLTVTDMTKRAQAERVLREAQKMQAIGQLTGGIAHDFNNLLTVILGNLEYVHGKLAGQAILQTRVERAVSAAGRGAALTSQLLAFARKQPLAPTAIDLAATMPDLVPLLRRTLGAHIDVRYVETAGLWPAMADPAQLESALLNLALNARDAMPGGGRLTIELANKVLDEDYARTDTDVTPGEYAMLAVSDTGHGMPPEVLQRVFEPFFTTKPDGKGTGLGLAMVFGFVKQSGGHVKVYSEPGEGTTVRIYLPRALRPATQQPARVGPPADLPRGSATILVVEDEPEVREVAAAILRELGYRVLEAADGEEGLRVFGAHTADIELLLTDVVLPGSVRGRELAERITSIRAAVQVLFMSGYTENSISHNGRLDDGVHLISKPFKRDQLARKVAELLKTAAASSSNVVELKSARAE